MIYFIESQRKFADSAKVTSVLKYESVCVCVCVCESGSSQKVIWAVDRTLTDT